MAKNEIKNQPEFDTAATRFQQTFSHYFPDLVGDIDYAADLDEWLQTRVHADPLETVRRSRAKRELPQIRHALNRIGRHDFSYWSPLYTAMLEAESNGDPLAEHVREIAGFFLALNEQKNRGDLAQAIDRFIKEAERAIDQVPDSGNINWQAIHAIDRLRVLWHRSTGKNAPSRALNPASTFAAYLRDGFDYLGISADPVSAFKRWVVKQRARK